MAEYRTLTGTFAISCVKRRFGNSTIYFPDDDAFTSENYVGHSYGENTEGWDYCIRLNPGTGSAFQYTSYTKIASAVVTAKFKKKTTADTVNPIKLKYGKATNTSTDPTACYTIIHQDEWYGDLINVYLDATTQKVEKNIAAWVEYNVRIVDVLQYGLAMTYDSTDLTEVSEVTITIAVQDEYVQPEISFVPKWGAMVGGTYHHNPNYRFGLWVSYTQNGQSATPPKLTGSATGLASTIVQQTVTYSDNLNLYGDDKLPASGTITLVANNGTTDSNTLTIPYVIDSYDVRFTAPTSGSVIQSDEDIVISWEAVAPSTQTMDAPNNYLTEIWFDNGEGSGGDYTTLTSKTITADQLTGHNQVHMRLYSYYDEYSVYREAAPVMHLYIQQVAGTGDVTVVDASQKPHIIIVSWESTGQTAYQVRVGDFTSEIIWGAKTQYNVPLVLEIGVTYPIQVRIQDTQGNWMDWTERIYFTPTSPLYENLEGVTATVTDGGVKITVDRPTEITESVYAKYSDAVIYRNGEPIAVCPIAEQIEYVDRAANGETVYSVAITRFSENEPFGLAAYFAPVTVDATPDTDGLVLADKAWLPLRYTVDEVQYSGAASEEVYQRYYSGRQYPVVMRSGRKTETLTLAYADPTGALADILSEQVGTVVLFKNLDGLRFWGCLESVSPTRHRGWCAVSLTLRKVDVNEWVPLVWGTEE